MKKAYVLEVKKEHLLVMTEEKKFLRLKKQPGVYGGEEILFSENQILDIGRKNSIRENVWEKIKHTKPVGIAAAMVLFLVLSIFALSGGEEDPHYLLSFDVNPSVGIEVGENDRVLEILPANDKAESLGLEDLEGESLETFLDEFLDRLEKNGYLNNETAQVLLSYADLSEDQEASQDLIDRVTDQMQNYFAEKNLLVDINTLLAEGENYESARSQGISLGKFQLIKEIEGEEEKAGKEASDIEATMETKEGEDVSLEGEAYENMSARELLNHPVFERHPRDRKADGLHPVFDVHPRDRNKGDGEKPHPVFDKHPGNPGSEGNSEGNNEGNNEGNSEGNNEEDDRDEGGDEEKDHPVFEEHPGNRNKDEGEHPVFDEHPKDRIKDEEKVPEDPEEGSEGSSQEIGESHKKAHHPVFKNQRDNSGHGKS